MGRLEKIVVLTVLFLVAVVLGVSLTPTGDPSHRDPKGGPKGTLFAELGDSPIVLPPGKPEEGKLPIVPAPGPKSPSDVPAPTPTPAPPIPKPEPSVAKYILTLDGLQPSGAADTMFYTWKQGDSFAAIALRYYGSRDKLTRLQQANEGRTEASMKVDEQLWIPVSESASNVAGNEGGNVYIVKKGDVLSGISQQFYGTSKKWQKILDANRDTLSSPEKLRPGMHLRIPE